MSVLRSGDRIGRQGVLRPGASAIIFDEAREKILLTQREDNARWCLPGGGMDPGESAAEACVREVLEETGLVARATKLVGIYTSPNLLIEYPDGNKIQPTAFSFEAEITGGELGLSDETTAFGWYTVAEMEAMDTMEHHIERVRDAIKNQPEAIFQ
ncbi:MAG: NUDIX domain-containing protein [SAR202 cluster bacterium]|nr:NUDIX domain-containing protein [SAR202 cluster bacterium]